MKELPISVEDSAKTAKLKFNKGEISTIFFHLDNKTQAVNAIEQKETHIDRLRDLLDEKKPCFVLTKFADTSSGVAKDINCMFLLFFFSNP